MTHAAACRPVWEKRLGPQTLGLGLNVFLSQWSHGALLEDRAGGDTHAPGPVEAGSWRPQFPGCPLRVCGSCPDSPGEKSINFHKPLGRLIAAFKNGAYSTKSNMKME